MADKKRSGGGTVAVCRRLAEPVAAELGLTLWDVRFVKEGASWYLRFIIDREEGVTLDDCVAMSRRMNPILDEADPVPHAYCMEVMSPGVERELTRPEHFAYCAGWPVTVRLIRPLDGVRDFAGVLNGLIDDQVVLDTEEGEKRFLRKDISSVRVIDDADVEIDDQDDQPDGV
ncbi:MAG: ribosome maturation factor RimP [Acutalibacteraceae bacterium]|jgi:ribosome maturation factor RimP